MFKFHDERYHKLAQSALESLLLHNREPTFLETVVNEWFVPLSILFFSLFITLPLSFLADDKKFSSDSYVGKQSSAATQGDFLALVDIFTRYPDYPSRLSVMLNLAMYKIADPDSNIRRSGELLFCLCISRPRICFGVEMMVSSSRPKLLFCSPFLRSATLGPPSLMIIKSLCPAPCQQHTSKLTCVLFDLLIFPAFSHASCSSFRSCAGHAFLQARKGVFCSDL